MYRAEVANATTGVPRITAMLITALRHLFELMGVHQKADKSTSVCDKAPLCHHVCSNLLSTKFSIVQQLPRLVLCCIIKALNMMNIDYADDLFVMNIDYLCAYDSFMHSILLRRCGN